MYLTGIINQDGLVDGALAAKSGRIRQTGRTYCYVLRAGEPFIAVTQNDVRAIQLAKQKLRSTKTKAKLYVRDATRLQGIGGPYELALDIGCFHGIPKVGKADYLHQLDRILTPNGFWLMYGFCTSVILDILPPSACLH